MAWQHDPELGLIIDTDTGLVYDDETQEPQGNVSDWYEGYDDEFEPGLSDEEFAAAYSAGAEENRHLLAEIQQSIAGMREDEARKRGYEAAQYERRLAEAREAQQQHAFDEAMTDLATRLNRHISAPEAEKIARLLPDSYSAEDLDRAAKSLGMASFTAPGREGRENRRAYFDSRMQEIERESDANYRAGGFDEIEDGGGMPAREITNRVSEAMRQATQPTHWNSPGAAEYAALFGDDE